MTTVFLIRHGEIDNPQKVFYGRTIDLSLNEEGKEQIKTVAQRIKDKGFIIEKIYTSPLKRGLQSSNIIASVLSIPPEKIMVENNLIDVDIPSLVGKPLSLRDKIHDSGTDEYNGEFSRQGNESRQQIVNRMKGVFDKVISENTGKTVALVSHGDPMVLLIDAIEHPEREVKSINILFKQPDYPQKGEAVKVVLDEKGRFVSKEFI